MYRYIKRFRTILPAALRGLCIVFFLAGTPDAGLLAHAEEVSSVYTVLSIQNSSYLSHFPEQTFSCSHPEETEQELERIRSYCSELNAVATDGAEEISITLEVSWNMDGIFLSEPGVYQMTGAILFPDSVIPGEDTLRQILIPVRILGGDVSLPIVDIGYYVHLDEPAMLETGDAAGWEEILEKWETGLNAAEGITEDNQVAELCLDTLDLGNVDICSPGSYTVTAHLKLAESNTLPFYLPEDLSVLPLSVQVYDPMPLKLHLFYGSSGHYYLTVLSDPEIPVLLQRLQSPVPLSEEELSDADNWEIHAQSADAEYGENPAYRILSDSLEPDIYYYFRLAGSAAAYSNTVCLKGSPSPLPPPTNGDRDGGDAQVPDETPEPIPDTPAEDPALPEVPSAPDSTGGSHSGSSPEEVSPEGNAPDTVPDTAEPEFPEAGSAQEPDVPESGSAQENQESSVLGQETSGSGEITREDSSQKALSGTQFMLMEDNRDVRFSQNGILMILSAEGAAGLSVSADDEISVSLEKSSDLRILVRFLKNGTPFPALPGTTILLPFTPAYESSSFTVINEDTRTELEGTFDPDSGILSFMTDEPGTFLISEEPADPTVPAKDGSETTDSGFPYGLLLPVPAVLILLILYAFHRKKNLA